MHGAPLLGPGRIGQIHHDQQPIGLQGFFQSGTESLHQWRWQVADEAHRVGDQRRFAWPPLGIGQIQPPGGGIQGGKQLVGGQHRRAAASAGEGVEQGALAGVGVAHQGKSPQALATPPQPFAVFAQLSGVPLQPLDAAGDGAAIFFQLGFPWTAGADAAALAGQAQAPAAEPRQAIAQLGQLHLQPAGGAGGPLGKDVEDQLAAVTHRQIQ